MRHRFVCVECICTTSAQAFSIELPFDFADTFFMKNFVFKKKYARFVLCVVLPILFFSCVTPPQKETVSREICGAPVKSAKSLFAFFLERNPAAEKSQIARMAKLYVEEAFTEGINSDVAFVQMCLETNYLRFGNLVSAEMHNYCGLGAIDENRRGEIFETERLGVRAHIQHLHAYGTTSDFTLKNALVDNRYKYVNPRGKASTVFELAGTWAADKEYGKKLDALLSALEAF